MRGLTFSAIAALAITGAATFAAAQPQQAGVSAAVRGQVALARASSNVVGRQVQSGDPIFLGDAITSGKSSGMQIMLMDETIFSIGPNSEISIDEFVYDPATDTGKVTASVAKGVFRFITGKIAQKRPEDMTVKLPTATIGIRGTIVAGAVRAAPGDDATVDGVFEGLKGSVDDAENAKEFVVLMGPGDENNTNDRGGAFVFTPNAPERAEGGLSAGAPAPGGLFGGTGNNSVEVSRPGSAVVAYGGGIISEPFIAPEGATNGISGGVSAQPAAGAKGSPDDSNAQEASETSSEDANALSGNTVAEAAAEGAGSAALADAAQQGGDITDPSAGGGANTFDFDDLRQITSGTATASNAISNLGPFVIGNSFFQLNFGNQTFQFDIQVTSGGGLASAQFGCFSTCTINYGNLPGAATFDRALIAGQANLTRVNCDNCGAVIGITSAAGPADATLNVTLDHTIPASGEVGEQVLGVGSASVNLNQ